MALWKEPPHRSRSSPLSPRPVAETHPATAWTGRHRVGANPAPRARALRERVRSRVADRLRLVDRGQDQRYGTCAHAFLKGDVQVDGNLGIEPAPSTRVKVRAATVTVSAK